MGIITSNLISLFTLYKLCLYTMAEEQFPENGTLLVGFIGFYQRWGPPFQLFLLGSAFLIALDKINNNETVLPNHTINYILSDDSCMPKKHLGEFVTLVKDKRVMGTIGPVCSHVAEKSGYLASFWNVPMVGYGGSSPQLSDKLVHLIIYNVYVIYSS